MKLSTVKMSEFKKMLPLVGGYMKVNKERISRCQLFIIKPFSKEVSSGRTDPANFCMNHHKDHPVFK